MTDPQRDSRLSSAFHEAETIVGGYSMRPLSLASYDVLLRTGNPLVKGDAPEEGTPEFTSSIMSFIFAHCAPWPEVVRASFNDQVFRESSLIFCGALTQEDYKVAFDKLGEQTADLEAAQVEAVSGLTEKKPSRNATSRVS